MVFHYIRRLWRQICVAIWLKSAKLAFNIFCVNANSCYHLLGYVKLQLQQNFLHLEDVFEFKTQLTNQVIVAK